MNTDLSNTLSTIIIGCHKDKALIDPPKPNPWEIQLQAGAALTDMRIYPQNDHDDFPNSISDRNQRYSEMTAIWWAYHNIHTPYVGIEHYRRRFCITPEELYSEIRNNTDVITLKKANLETPMSKQMKCFEYTSVYYVFLDIVNEYHPEDLELTQRILNDTYLRGCNMNIWKLDVFKTYCDWIFPMLDAFYHKVPEKTDTYLRRDVGFAAELLTYIYIEKLISQGAKISETWFNQLVSVDTEEKTEINYSDPEDVIKTADYYFKLNRLINCYSTLLNGINQTPDLNIFTKYYEKPVQLFTIYNKEKKIADTTLLEYLPAENRETINCALQTIDILKRHISQLLYDPSSENELSFSEHVRQMNYSGVAIWLIASSISNNHEIAEYLAAILNDANMNEKADEIIYTANQNISG